MRIAIYVMNDFTITKKATNCFFGNGAMLVAPAALHITLIA